MVEEKYIPVGQVPGRYKGGGIWDMRFARLKGGEAIILYPNDAHHAHILRTVAHQNAAKRTTHIFTRVVEKGEKLELFIWIA